MARFNLPPLTRILLAMLMSFTVLNTILRDGSSGFSWFTRIGRGSPFFSLIPGSSFLYLWTFFTATFVEQNIFGLGVTGLTIYFGGRYLERAWGSREFAKFIGLITLIPNLLCFCTYIVFYGASQSPKALQTTISGGIAIQSSFLVSFKQLVPEHTISILSVLRLRVKHLPSLFLLSNAVSAILLGTETALFLATFAFHISWIYLRFFRRTTVPSIASTSDNPPTIRGDASDTFAYAYFFPEPLQSPIAAVGDKVYDLLVQLRLCTPFSDDDVELSNESANARAEGAGAGLPSLMTRGSGRREEAERRRALALRALDQRLHAAAATRATPPAGQLAVDGTGSISTAAPQAEMVDTMRMEEHSSIITPTQEASV